VGMFDLDGQTALVTGASSGLGRHFALTLARHGADVVLAARRVDACRSLAGDIQALGRRARVVALDVTDPASVAAAVAEAGTVSILCNNAGVAVTRPFLEQSEADWNTVIDTNLTGAARVARAVARGMVERGRGGAIVNIASILAFRTAKQVAGYAAAKAGLVQLTRVLALELAPHDIRVNALAPGYIETEINRAFFQSEAGRKLIRRIPQKRLGQPNDLDGALLLLAAPAGAYLTGSVITVDGGHSVGGL
jgi:NAD(P)-dependent dehydrogenase (short-subunit alcohol dehydrogenase family)